MKLEHNCARCKDRGCRFNPTWGIVLSLLASGGLFLIVQCLRSWETQPRCLQGSIFITGLVGIFGFCAFRRDAWMQACKYCNDDSPYASNSSDDWEVTFVPLKDGQLCAQCGYDLRGLQIGGSCPECGAPIRIRLEPPAHKRRRLWELLALAATQAGLFLGCYLVADIRGFWAGAPGCFFAALVAEGYWSAREIRRQRAEECGEPVGSSVHGWIQVSIGLLGLMGAFVLLMYLR